MSNPLESAQLFIPGRASYITTDGSGAFNLNLSPASIHRADVAAHAFQDYGYHTNALFSGGYPGIAQQWPAEHIPPPEQREAYLMAQPLKERLGNAGWSATAIAQKVSEQGDSNNSIDDVVKSLERGFLDPEHFHGPTRHGIEIVAGGLHAARFKYILMKALDLDPAAIQRTPMHDVYGSTATQFRSAESRSAALAKEVAAISITKYVLKKVRPGSVDDLRDAEAHFNAIAIKF